MYADIAVCLPLVRTFVYRVNQSVETGCRVIVPFRKREVVIRLDRGRTFESEPYRGETKAALTVVLRRLYWKAGIEEYWLIDPRGPTLRFDIFRRGKKGYEPTKARNGWLKSGVFGKSFRLSMKFNGLDLPVFTLDVR